MHVSDTMMACLLTCLFQERWCTPGWPGLSQAKPHIRGRGREALRGFQPHPCPSSENWKIPQVRSPRFEPEAGHAQGPECKALGSLGAEPRQKRAGTRQPRKASLRPSVEKSGSSGGTDGSMEPRRPDQCPPNTPLGGGERQPPALCVPRPEDALGRKGHTAHSAKASAAPALPSPPPTVPSAPWGGSLQPFPGGGPGAHSRPAATLHGHATQELLCTVRTAGSLVPRGHTSGRTELRCHRAIVQG